MSDTVVCALYKFVALENHQALKQPLLNQMLDKDIRGSLLLAKEGINGTVAGSRQAIDELLLWLESDPLFNNLLNPVERKESLCDKMPFKRSRVKLKKEIVTMGLENIDPRHSAGTYVEPEDWNQLISDPDVMVIDTRNDYEIQVGTFQNAINPETQSFREFPDYVNNKLDRNKDKKVAMFCTGGIRCEKSTALLKELGFEEVYHLKGGILKYLEDIPEDESLWEGECFVFDDRVTVNHRLEKGQYDQCHGCRLPIKESDKASEKYEKGVSCPHCFDSLSDNQIRRFRQRQTQIELANLRGEAHIGTKAAELTTKKRELKKQKQAQKNNTTNISKSTNRKNHDYSLSI